MAQSISLWGAQYSGVGGVKLPKTGGGTASFTDVTDTTATASDVASGKWFFTSSGVKTQGTASGGGGTSWTKLATGSLTVSTTSTSAASAGTLECGTDAYTKSAIIWVHIRGNSGKRAGYFYGSDAFLVNSYKANNETTAFQNCAIEYIRVNSDGRYTTMTGSYGVYPYSMSSTGTLTIRRRYNSSNTLTINDTFTVEVYSLALPTGVTLFA